MFNLIKNKKIKFGLLWIIINLLFLLSSVSGHKQTVVSASWHQATGGLLGEVCHEQPALWQAHEPQATTSLAGQSPPCVSLCVFVSLPHARSIWNSFLVSRLWWLPSHGWSSSTHTCTQSCAGRAGCVLHVSFDVPLFGNNSDSNFQYAIVQRWNGWLEALHHLAPLQPGNAQAGLGFKHTLGYATQLTMAQ